MSPGRLALAALALLAAGPAPAAAAPPEIGLVMDGRPGADGWYVGEVVLRWSVGGAGLLSTRGCETAQRLTDETAGTAHTCTATNASGSASRTALVRIDRTWTTAPRLGLRRALGRGLYRWYVWPGYGDRAERRYGRLALRAAFRIRR